MSRYIDVNATLEILKNMLYETALNNYPECKNFADACEEIAERMIAIWIELVPTVDVREVVHGEWQFNNLNGFKIYDCSNCGIHMEARWNYCPHCGARMDGGK